MLGLVRDGAGERADVGELLGEDVDGLLQLLRLVPLLLAAAVHRPPLLRHDTDVLREGERERGDRGGRGQLGTVRRVRECRVKGQYKDRTPCLV